MSERVDRLCVCVCVGGCLEKWRAAREQAEEDREDKKEREERMRVRKQFGLNWVLCLRAQPTP